jgi:hypothetical protein
MDPKMKAYYALELNSWCTARPKPAAVHPTDNLPPSAIELQLSAGGCIDTFVRLSSVSVKSRLLPCIWMEYLRVAERSWQDLMLNVALLQLPVFLWL